MRSPLVLIIEDEEPISLLIKYNLEKEGFATLQAFDDEQAFDILEKEVPDLILLDWMLPEMSGIEIAKELRTYDVTKKIPVIMLTAKSAEADKLKGFDNDIDDYITKPFSPKELIARIKTVLKRTSPQLLEAEISYEGIIVDNIRKVITANGIPLKLGPTEYDLLEFLVIKAEKVCSRNKLLLNVWKNNEEVEARAVDVAIRRIRAELEKKCNGKNKLIKSIRGEGYILEKI